MLTSVLTPLLQPARATKLPQRTSVPSSPAAGSSALPAQSADHLASEILADGGLGFIQARLQEKMGNLFGSSESSGTPSFDSSLDLSPEATADRIVGMALGLRGVYDRLHEGQSEEERRSGFEEAIRRGISEGFGHATGVLSGLGFLEGEIQDNVDRTWDLVQLKLDEIFNPQTVTPEAG